MVISSLTSLETLLRSSLQTIQAGLEIIIACATTIRDATIRADSLHSFHRRRDLIIN